MASRAAEVLHLGARRRREASRRSRSGQHASLVDLLEPRVLLVGEPVIVTNGGFAYTEGDPPVAVFGDVTVTDADSPDFDGGSFTLALYGAEPGDSIAPLGGGNAFDLNGDLVADGVVIGTESSVTQTVEDDRVVNRISFDLNADANAARVELLIEAISFEAFGTTGDDLEPYGFRDVEVVLDDGDGNVGSAEDFVDVLGEDDPIVLTFDDSQPLAVTEDAGPVTLLPSVQWSDVDNTDFLDAIITVEIQTGFDVGDAISLDPTSGFSIVDEELSLNGEFLGLVGDAPGFFDVYLEGDGFSDIDASVVDGLLAALQFETTDDSPELTKTVLVSYDAPDGDFAEVIQTIAVTPVNDPTIIDSDADTPLAFTENGDPVPLLGDVTITDADFENPAAGDVEGWQILARSVAGRQAGERYVVSNTAGQSGPAVLVVGSTVNVNGSDVATITSSGSLLIVELGAGATHTDAELILEAITYQTVSNDPAELKRGQVWLTDAGGNRTILERDINVTTSNDDPAIANIRGSLTFFEDGGPRLLSGQAHVADVDWSGGGSLSLSWTDFGAADEILLLDRGIISSSGDLAAPATGDELFYNGTKLADVTVTDNGATGEITFDLVPVTNRFEAREIFRALAFDNPTDNPEPGTRTVTFTFTDEAGAAASRSMPIFMRLSNDAPDLMLANPIVTGDSSAPATPLGVGASVSDPDSPSFDGGRFVVSLVGGRQAGDRLQLLDEAGNAAATGDDITVGGTVVGTLSQTAGSQVRVSFGPAATQTDVAAVLNRVAYENVGNVPVPGDRTVQFLLVDPTSESDIETATLSVDVAANAPLPSGTLDVAIASLGTGDWS